ncbi:MAG TPA: HD-GYP domain-containing protein, partial [Halanaerobiales bacterium]|nr:HD-GYP domain-containing protein [Halanaerobiales bacterium]
LGSLAYFFIDNGLVYLVVRLDNGNKNSSLVLYYIQLFKSLIISYFLGLILYYAYINYGKFLIILSIVLIYILKDLMYSRIQQINSLTQIVESFLKVIDSKDHYTEGHCERVGNYCRLLCKELNFSVSRRERIVNMAKIHDIGKIYVPDDILKSSGKLTPEQYEEMKKHSFYGYELLNDIDILRDDLKILLYHHERYDGLGYPEGKKGEEIPREARILCICDAFDVMTTGRDYKPAMNMEMVIQEIKSCSGTQFDPLLAGKMIELIERGRFDDSFRNYKKEKNRREQLKLNLGFGCNKLEG